MTVYYVASGVVRGDCRHQHKTAEDAERCVRDDRLICRRAGGDSDRVVYRVLPGDRRQVVKPSQS